MKTIYVVHENDVAVEQALTAFGKSEIEARHLRILALHDTKSAFHARRAGVSANVALGLAAAPHEERGRKERIKTLLEDSGLKGKAYEGLIHAIDRGQVAIAVDVPEEKAERARAILSLQERR
ncbi:MAG: hypothetical protein ACOC47_02905 [Alkalispirochaetaceae bacterium]